MTTLKQLELFPPSITDEIREDATPSERAQLGACDDASIASEVGAPSTPVDKGKSTSIKTCSPKAVGSPLTKATPYALQTYSRWEQVSFFAPAKGKEDTADSGEEDCKRSTSCESKALISLIY